MLLGIIWVQTGKGHQQTINATGPLSDEKLTRVLIILMAYIFGADHAVSAFKERRQVTSSAR